MVILKPFSDTSYVNPWGGVFLSQIFIIYPTTI